MNPAEVADLLPEIMRRLMGGRPAPTALRALTLPQFGALKTITFRPSCTMGELAKALGVTLGAATGLVDRLIQQGLVERVSDPEDRRLVRVRLTAKGRRTHASAARKARRRMGAALAALSLAQQAQIAAALALLREALSRSES